MKFQVCNFKRTADSPWERGIAQVLNFGEPDVQFIIDAEGNRADNHFSLVYDYRLIDGPLCHLETDFIGMIDEYVKLSEEEF